MANLDLEHNELVEDDLDEFGAEEEWDEDDWDWDEDDDEEEEWDEEEDEPLPFGRHLYFNS